MTIDQRARLAFLREVAAGLREEFARIVQEFKAGNISLTEEAAMLVPVVQESGQVADEMFALIEAMAITE